MCSLDCVWLHCSATQTISTFARPTPVIKMTCKKTHLNIFDETRSIIPPEWQNRKLTFEYHDLINRYSTNSQDTKNHKAMFRLQMQNDQLSNDSKICSPAKPILLAHVNKKTTIKLAKCC